MPVSASLWAASAAIRVASLNLCTDEYLLLLAQPGEIASVSRLSQDPADSPLAARARRYDANDGTLESVLGSRPTLILTMGGGGRATRALGRRMGISTLDLTYPATIADVDATMMRIASALGRPAAASKWRARLARLRSSPVGSRDAIFLTGKGMSVDPRSLAGEWMRLAGFRQRSLSGGRASLETLALHPPAVVLRSTYRRAQPSLGQRWLEHPLVRRLEARTILTDGRAWTCAGPLMLDEVERLRALR